MPKKTEQSLPATPLASGPATTTRCGQNPSCEGLRASIKRLQGELAERQAQARPMPSSVMRAYQKLIDRHFSALATHDHKKSENSNS